MTSVGAVPARTRGDDGAALIEFALLLPLLVALFLGVIEFGSAYRVDDQTQHSLMSAGRVAGQQSNGRYADYETLRSLNSALAGNNRATIKRVIVYRVLVGDSGKPSAACLAITPTGSKAGVAGDCNVYNGAQAANLSLAPFGTATACAGTAWDSNWCPVNRLPQSQRIGVFVELNVMPFTGLLPSNFTISRNTVYDVEPTPLQS